MAVLTKSQKHYAQWILHSLTVGTIVDFRHAVRGRVFVDGIERNYITRCKLGPDGWAEQIVRTIDNRPVVTKGFRLVGPGGRTAAAGLFVSGKPRIKRRIIKGTVAFRPYNFTLG